MRRKKYPVPQDSEANICFFCKRACGGCSWSEFDPETGRPRFQPVPGWRAKPAKLYHYDPETGEAWYTDTWHITACPLFVLDRLPRPGRPRKEEADKVGAAVPGQTSGGSDAQDAKDAKDAKTERSGRKMPKRRKPRLCSRFYCESREGKFCCVDCRMRRRCENSCLNDPSRCGLQDKTRRVG